VPDVNVDKVLEAVSRVLHPRVVTALAALVPGFFFEACVLMANPQIAELLTRRASVLSRYTPVFLSLLFAFVLGSAFMLWVTLLQSTVRTIFRIWTWIVPWDRLLDRWLVHVNQHHITQIAGQPPQPGQPQRPFLGSRHFRFVQWLGMRRAMRRALHDETVNAWTATASTLLKRYGLDYRERYDPWTEVLGHLTIQDLRGYTLGTTLHATGWAGLAAVYFAHALNATPFKVLCVLFIFGGMVQALRLAEDSAHSIWSWVIGLANTWKELKEAPPPAENKPRA
jgi:hypothetical protein